MFAKEKLMSEAVVKVRKMLRLTTGSNHNYARTSFDKSSTTNLDAQISEQMSLVGTQRVEMICKCPRFL